MNIQRKEIPVTINEKEYNFVLDFRAAIDFQEYYGKSILMGLEKISEEQDIFALACLVASCLKSKVDNKGVGMDFVGNMDLLGCLPMFMEIMPQLVDNSLPVEDEPNKKK